MSCKELVREKMYQGKGHVTISRELNGLSPSYTKDLMRRLRTEDPVLLSMYLKSPQAKAQLTRGNALPVLINAQDMSKRANSMVTNELKQERKEKEELQERVRELSDKLEFYSTIEDGIVSHTIHPVKHKGSDATAIAVLSDIHVEERVSKGSVNNLNEYNLDIAKARIEKFFQKVLFLTEHERQITPIRTFILAILGDTIAGHIHDELVESNYMSPVQAILFIQEQLVSGIDFLLRHGNFEQIVIPCCYGNHGRTTKKPRHSTGAQNNFEWMMYKNMETHYQNNKKVKFVISSGYHCYLDVYKFVLRFHHGDAIRYQGGIGGLFIPANKAIGAWNRAKPAYLDIFGHYHQLMDGGSFISNGSVVGYNAFALSIKAAYEKPQQVFLVLDKDRGKTAVRPIFLD